MQEVYCVEEVYRIQGVYCLVESCYTEKYSVLYTEARRNISPSRCILLKIYL